MVIGWRVPEDPEKKPIPVKRTKGGFPTKAAAIAACPSLMGALAPKSRATLQDVYSAWYQSYAARVGSSTMVCYRAAYKHFAPLHSICIDLITARDLQQCMDACPSEKEHTRI